MSVVEGPRSSGLVARVQAILMHPSAEWDVIAGESATIPGLFTGYAIILAAIGPIVSVLWGLAIVSMPFIHMLLPLAHLGAMAVIGSAIVSYFQGLVTVFAIGVIVDALAPSFDGQKDSVQAMKLTVYSATGGWVGALFMIIPILGWIAAIGLAIYSLYLFWLGLPKLMAVPEEKRAAYAIVVLLAAIVAGLIIGILFAAVRTTLLFGSMMSGGMF